MNQKRRRLLFFIVISISCIYRLNAKVNRVVTPSFFINKTLINSDSLKNNKRNFLDKINVRISFPLFNHLYLKAFDGDNNAKNGFLGLTYGAEYRYRDSKYISLLYGSGATEKFSDILDVFFIPEEQELSREVLYTGYISLNNNVIHEKWNYGYGVNYSYNSWNEKTAQNRLIRRGESRSLGITTNVYYNIWNRLFVGLVYRPTFLDVQSRKASFKYEHYACVELFYRFIKWKN